MVFIDTKIVRVALGNGRPNQGMVPFWAHPQIPRHGNPPAYFFVNKWRSRSITACSRDRSNTRLVFNVFSSRLWFILFQWYLLFLILGFQTNRRVAVGLNAMVLACQWGVKKTFTDTYLQSCAKFLYFIYAPLGPHRPRRVTSHFLYRSFSTKLPTLGTYLQPWKLPKDETSRRRIEKSL